MKEYRIINSFREFARYCKKNYILGFLLAVIIALVYGKQAFSTDFYVDAEIIINHPHSIYNWNQIGRFGLIGIKMLMEGNWYNPYMEAVLFLITLWFNGMGLCYLYSIIIGKLNTCIGIIFVSLFLIYPTYADQFMFRFQSFEIALGMLLVVWATIYFYMFYNERNKEAFVIAVCMEILSFGIYQSMVNLQICFFIALYLFHMTKLDQRGRKRLILNSILLFMVGFVIYEFIVQLFFSEGEYLTEQVGWLSGDLLFTIRNLLAYVKRILLSLDVFYPITFFASVIAGLVLLICFFIHQRKDFFVILQGIGAMLVSPFFLAIITGQPTVYRAQCMLPFVGAIMWLFTLEFVKNKKTLHNICIVLGCIFLFMQGSVLMRMQYTQDIIREADEIQAIQIIDRIEQVKEKNTDKPIVFIGHLDAKTNKSCYTKEQASSFLSYSVYEFAYVVGVPIEIPNYYNTGRILGFFETMGFLYRMPTKEMVAEAETKATQLPCWPAVGSVCEKENYILVKLN